MTVHICDRFLENLCTTKYCSCAVPHCVPAVEQGKQCFKNQMKCNYLFEDGRELYQRCVPVKPEHNCE